MSSIYVPSDCPSNSNMAFVARYSQSFAVAESLQSGNGTKGHSTGGVRPKPSNFAVEAIRQSNDKKTSWIVDSLPCRIVSTSKFAVYCLVSPVSVSFAPLRPLLPFTDLTDFVKAGAIEELGEYLATKPLFDFNGKSDSTGFIRTDFSAAGRKHADEIKLHDRCGFGEDANWPEAFDFRDCRALRGSAEYWRHNRNAVLLPDLVTFVDNLPFFVQTGKITIILSPAGSHGVEHVDHKFEDLVSEFVWLRTGVGHSKRFFIRDADGDKRYVEKDSTEAVKETAGRGYGECDRQGCCIWFDDHHAHNTESSKESTYSIRVDGVFTDEFRAHICSIGVFSKASLRAVLEAQRSSPLSPAAAASVKRARALAYGTCTTNRY